MKALPLSVAYMPLVDAAPLIVAQEMGFARAQGIALDLIPAPSWSSVRDMLAFGRVDAAHLLSPVPIAAQMGLGGVAAQLAAVSVLSVNGTAIGVSRQIEAQLRAQGYGFDFADPVALASALARLGRGALTIGVPFPFSMHVNLLRYWCANTDLGRDGIQIRTVPPPLMASALAAGEVDAFCVGEPWGSVAVEQGAGALVLPGKAIWQFAPEKVLAVRGHWAETEPELLGRLMRAVWQAGRWLAKPQSRTTATELLSRADYLDVPSELIDRALSGQFVITSRGEQRHVPGFVEFHAGAATFPWRSQAMWMAQELGRAHGRDVTGQLETLSQVFRSDLYRTHLAGHDCDTPGASQKVEGAIRRETPVASARGGLSLLPDGFFDGRIFDPAQHN